MRTVTKAQAAVILGISPAEVIRQIEGGQLKGHKKTASKYSDWLVEVPDSEKEKVQVDEVKKVLSKPELEPEPEPESEPEPEPEEEHKEEAAEIQQEIEESARTTIKHKSEQKSPKVTPLTPEDKLPKLREKEVKADAEPKRGRQEGEDKIGWWYGNRG